MEWGAQLFWETQPTPAWLGIQSSEPDVPGSLGLSTSPQGDQAQKVGLQLQEGSSGWWVPGIPQRRVGRGLCGWRHVGRSLTLPACFLFAHRGAVRLTQGPQVLVCPSLSQLSLSKAQTGQGPSLSSGACEKLSLSCTFICLIYCRSG